MSRDVDDMLKNYTSESITINKSLNDMVISEGLTTFEEDEDNDIFIEDPEVLKKRKQQTKAQILLEQKKVQRNYPDVNKYVNK